jgi:Domain of unknown function (DUF4384)
MRMNSGWEIGVVSAAAVVLAWPLAAAPQDAGRLTARQLFYTTQPAAKEAPKPPAVKPAVKVPIKKSTIPAPPAGAAAVPKTEPPAAVPTAPPAPTAPQPQAAAPYLGLRYSLLQLNEDKLQEVDPEKVFHSGDRIQLKLQSNSSGYLYIVLQGSMGDWKVMFPSKEIRHGDNLVTANTPILIPGGEDSDFAFDKNPGAEKLFIVLSRQPEQEMDSLIYSLKGHSARPAQVASANLQPKTTIASADFEPVRGRLGSRGLELSKRQTWSTPEEKAVYIVNASTGSSDRVIADVVLKHE